jgi:ribonucleoside-diphosphate reductase alpha chain
MTAARRVLPQRRHVETFELKHRTETTEQTYTVSVGYFESGPFVSPAEVFVSGSKVGSAVEAVARDATVLLSIALQFGVPLEVIHGAITRDASGHASSIIGAIIDHLAVNEVVQQIVEGQ